MIDAGRPDSIYKMFLQQLHHQKTADIGYIYCLKNFFSIYDNFAKERKVFQFTLYSPLCTGGAYGKLVSTWLG